MPGLDLVYHLESRRHRAHAGGARWSASTSHIRRSRLLGDRHVGRAPPSVAPTYPQVVVLMGATGDLSQRKLLPGLFQLSRAGFIPGCRIIGVSKDDFDTDGFRTMAREALHRFSIRGISEADWAAFAETLDYVPLAAGAGALLTPLDTPTHPLRPALPHLHTPT